ncbi:ROK family protein [Streptomyces sp. NPDC101181]|uniref:ROK family protein n=1 Tax=Streptomyces sp. NPDC101181 TaxID=3366125 RepID=UPI0037F7606B
MFTPVLEIGGTHVSAALVDPDTGTLAGPPLRAPLPAQGSADAILGGVLEAAAGLPADPGATWGVAVPGPFDHERGIACFEGVGKFEALYGVDVGAALRAGLPQAPGGLAFLNDAVAFGVGEHAAGAGRGHDRAVFVTLGSGVGSAFLADGTPVTAGPAVPPEGYAHLLTYDGRPLEDTVSRRGIRAAYARAALDDTDVVPDVRAIAERAREGDRSAGDVLDHAFRALGETLAPWLHRFGATVLVVGGSIAASWDLIEAPLQIGLGESPAPGPAVRTARHPEHAPLLGAGRWALRTCREPAPGGAVPPTMTGTSYAPAP